MCLSSKLIGREIEWKEILNLKKKKKQGRRRQIAQNNVVINANILVITVHINWQNSLVNRKWLSDWVKKCNLVICCL